MKILYTTTIGETMTFFKSLIKELVEEGHVVDIGTNEDTSKVPEIYRELGCKIYQISWSRSPFAVGNIKAVSELRNVVKQGSYDIVHCHTPIGAACTRLACRVFRNKGVRVIYTAHGFHFYKGAPLLNWLLYFPVEWLCSWFTDVLITINQEDYAFAQKHMHAKKIVYVPGVGIDLEKFNNNLSESRIAEIRQELSVQSDEKMLLSVGELNKNKNHEVVIRALAKLDNPKIKYFIAGRGGLQKYLEDLIVKLGLQNQVKLLGYRDDIAKLYACSDLCVFPSIREGLGLAALEGMASGLPLICADNRGTRDYAEDGDNAIVCKYNDVDAFADAIRCLIGDEKMCDYMGRTSKKIARCYELTNVVGIMKEVYGKVCYSED